MHLTPVASDLFTAAGWRIHATLEATKAPGEPEGSEALEMLQVALQLRTDSNDLPDDIMLDERIGTLDVAKNPLTKPVFEPNLRERTTDLLVALGHAPDEMERRLRGLDEEQLDGLFKAVLNVVKGRNNPEMVRKLDDQLSVFHP